VRAYKTEPQALGQINQAAHERAASRVLCERHAALILTALFHLILDRIPSLHIELNLANFARDPQLGIIQDNFWPAHCSQISLFVE
jgi:hypothetical protein